MAPAGESRVALARRLKALREEWWPELGLTQAQLAHALGDRKPLSVSLISSWENVGNPTTPPPRRLQAYATIFATRRSVEEDKVRRLPLTALTDDELAEREELLAELMSLREGTARASAEPPAANVWRFPEGENVTIVCARLPAKFRDRLSYADPESPDFVSLYTYADPDALIELFGHIRALNPDNRVNFHTVDELGPDHFTGHLVLLGGVDFNYATREVLERVKLPVKQIARDQESDRGGFRVDREGRSELFAPKLDENGHLVEDVAHFYCGASPYNRKRTVTVCNGMYGRGTLGAVRALTDSRFRDRNQAYLDGRFAGEATFSIVSRVPVMKGGQVLTPDWTLAENRLHEWPEKSAR